MTLKCVIRSLNTKSESDLRTIYSDLRSQHAWPSTGGQQEDQLMLTNLRDVYGGQSRSPNIVPLHMLGIVSYCAIVTLSVMSDIRLQKMS